VRFRHRDDIEIEARYKRCAFCTSSRALRGESRQHRHLGAAMSAMRLGQARCRCRGKRPADRDDIGLQDHAYWTSSMSLPAIATTSKRALQAPHVVHELERAAISRRIAMASTRAL